MDSQYLRELFEEEEEYEGLLFSKEEKEKFLQKKYIAWLERKVMYLDKRLKGIKP